MTARGAGPEGKLAIIAGRDALPRLIAERRRDAGLPYLVISFRRGTQDWMAAHPHEEHEFERVGRLFDSLRKAGCGHVVLAGAMNRPRMKLWRADAKTLKLMAQSFSLLAKGDDGLLSGLVEILGEEGFTVVSAQDCLDDLTAEAAVLTGGQPAQEDRADAMRGAAILHALGPHDIGQAVVVAGGVCLGIEAIEGTDALLARIAGLPPERRHLPPPSGVLVKMVKAGQDRRVDMPTIGLRTVEGAARAGLRGIVIEAGATNILDREAVIAAAEAAGLFLWSVTPGALAE